MFLWTCPKENPPCHWAWPPDVRLRSISAGKWVPFWVHPQRPWHCCGQSGSPVSCHRLKPEPPFINFTILKWTGEHSINITGNSSSGKLIIKTNILFEELLQKANRYCHISEDIISVTPVTLSHWQVIKEYYNYST